MPSRGNPKHEARYDEIPTRDEGGDARTSGSERRFFARVRRYNTFHRLRARGAASHRRLSGRSPGSLALLELDGVHGDVAPDQHDGGARGAEHHGAALGLRGRGRGGKVAGEFSVIAMSKTRACRRADFGKRTRTRAEERGGGGFGRYAPRRCRTSSRRGCTPAVGKEARVGKVSDGTAREKGNPSKNIVSQRKGRAAGGIRWGAGTHRLAVASAFGGGGVEAAHGRGARALRERAARGVDEGTRHASREAKSAWGAGAPLFRKRANLLSERQKKCKYADTRN